MPGLGSTKWSVMSKEEACGITRKTFSWLICSQSTGQTF